MHNSVIFSIITELCNYYHNFRTFYHPRKKPYTLWPLPSISPSPIQEALEEHFRAFVSVDFLSVRFVGVESEHAVFGDRLLLLSVVSPRSIRVAARVPCLHRYRSTRMDAPRCAPPGTRWWASGLSSLVGGCDRCCHEHSCTAFRVNMCFHFQVCN